VSPHDHVFGTDQTSRGERRTRWVVGITAAMMAGEVVAGTVFGSMALLADGWHMGTHAAALGVTVFAYAYARRHAADPDFTFGTGKVGALGGFASAVGLGVVALLVFVESAVRLASPVGIRFGEAMTVAVLGLAVNLGCAALLHGHDDDEHHHDHNLRGAYLHVIADAMTSVLAVAALAGGMLLGWAWLDPLTGVAGSVVIAKWSLGLLRDTAAVLLDAEVPQDRRDAIRSALESEPGTRVTDLHLWRVGPRHFAAEVVVSAAGDRGADDYRARLATFPDVVHSTIEVRRG